jgi:aminopeptidase N
MLKTSEQKPVRLVDYQVPDYLVSTVHLTFELHEKETLVASKIHFQRNIKSSNQAKLVLNGVSLKLIEVVLDEKVLTEADYQLDATTLTISNVPDAFILKIKNRIRPDQNTALYGIYESNGFICSHNEPEGFRNITYFPDRPDIMAKFTTTLIADEKKFPVLLSNGNLIERKKLPHGKHQAIWEDPFAKPCYLFALVAGKLDVLEDVYITKSKKKVDLAFYTEPGKTDRAKFAMQCLKNAMRFDEEVFNLEYDLSCYMIVAVDFFNMGAMENKGLNIFNTTTCFADEKTATDDNFSRVETVVGHEYFHNYSGNRIGVRDWFQLTLKEGLTVFRDQEFTCYLHDRVVKRIEDVTKLRYRQFPEDQGPTSHPIQPKEYIEINNFYTPTIYDKGAEVVRMLKTLLGDEIFFKGCKIFFERYDGIAATIESWIDAMQMASNKDLEQFRRWYHQNGLLNVEVESFYDESKKTILLKVKQSIINGSSQQPLYFPLKVGLIDMQGKPLHFHVQNSRKEKDSYILEVKERTQEFVLEEVSQESVVSINRDFSAPCVLKNNISVHDLCHLASYDTDFFNRFESFQTLAKMFMQEQIIAMESNQQMVVDTRFLALFGKLLKEPLLSHAMKAKLLKLPEENELSLDQEVIAIDGNYAVRKFFCQVIAKYFEKDFLDLYEKLYDEADYVFDGPHVAKRRLMNLCLFYLSFIPSEETPKLIFNQFEKAKNMTAQYAALELLCQMECKERKAALDHFYKQFESDPLVLIKWLVAQAQSKLPTTLDDLKRLTAMKGFQKKMPNHIRALYMTFAENTSIFHDSEGLGYAFYFDALKDVDSFNPQTAALMAQSLKRVYQLPYQHKKVFKEAVSNLMEQVKLSSNVLEILNKLKSSC